MLRHARPPIQTDSHQDLVGEPKFRAAWHQLHAVLGDQWWGTHAETGDDWIQTYLLHSEQQEQTCSPALAARHR
jgi:hypothetical protein